MTILMIVDAVINDEINNNSASLASPLDVITFQPLRRL